MYKRIGLSGFAALALLATATARAELQPGFYAGAGIGSSTIEVGAFDESDTSFKVFGGYSFNDNFGVELTYFDGGAPDATIRAGNITSTVSSDLTAIVASAVGRLPLSEMFALFGKVGIASYEFEMRQRVNNVPQFSIEESDQEVIYGVGAAFSFGQFEVRGEYEVTDVSEADFNSLWVSGVFRF